MPCSASPLPRQTRRCLPLWRNIRLFVSTFVLGAVLFSLSNESAAARVAVQRDRRSDREVTVPYRRAPLSHRQSSGYVERDQPGNASDRRSSAISGENEQAPSNRNDGNRPVRDTDRRLRR